MNTFTPKERAELAAYREAIDIIFDSGRWERVDGELVWLIPEKAADRVQAMIGDMDA